MHVLAHSVYWLASLLERKNVGERNSIVRWCLRGAFMCALLATYVCFAIVCGVYVCVPTQSSGFEIPALRPACARLANSMVGVLGPEFTLGSSYYRMAKSQTTDLVQTGVTAVDDIVALAALNAAPAAGGAGGRAGASAGTPEVSGAPRPVGLESLACELQALLFVQQAILFAPRAVQAAKHVPMLQVCALLSLVHLQCTGCTSIAHAQTHV